MTEGEAGRVTKTSRGSLRVSFPCAVRVLRWVFTSARTARRVGMLSAPWKEGSHVLSAGRHGWLSSSLCSGQHCLLRCGQGWCKIRLRRLWALVQVFVGFCGVLGEHGGFQVDGQVCVVPTLHYLGMKCVWEGKIPMNPMLYSSPRIYYHSSMTLATSVWI